MKHCRFSGVIWVSSLICAISAWFLTSTFAQDPNWEKNWDSGVRDKWFKDDKTDPKKPTRRLAPVCKECQGLADQLQNALDDWYVLQYAEGEAIRKDGLKKQDGDVQKAGNDCKANALAGLGQPNAKDLKAKQDKQKKDAKDDPKKFGDKKALAAEIERLKKLLDDCLYECNKPKEITPTPTPTPTPAEEVPPPPVFDIVVPKLPPCFDTERDREKYRKELDEISAKLALVFKKYDQELFKPPNQAWKDFRDKFQKAKDDVTDQNFPGDDGKDKIDKVPVPCKKTATGGGTAKTPTPKPGKPKKAPRIPTGGNVSLGGGQTEDFCTQISENKIKVDITGTGETIGRIAEARVSNLTDEPIAFTIPPTVLESRSGKNQNYGIPQSTDVTLKPHEAKTIPLDGVCLNRNKPPVGKGIGDDLAFNDCDPNPRIEQDDSDRMLRIAETVYEAADKLEEEGKLKDIPYKDPNKRKDIVKQWATWIRMSEITGDPPPTEDDLKKVVEKQVGKVPPDKQKKIDEGIDTIFDAIELTTEKAKDLDKPEPEEEGTPAIPSGTGENVSNDTPTPTPQTEEKKKKIGKNKKKKKYPKQIQDWVDKYNAAQDAEETKQWAKDKYDAAKKEYFDKSKPHGELEKARDEAKKKADAPGSTPQDKSDYDKAQKELDANEKALEKDFQQTDDGKKAFDEYRQWEKAAKNAQDEAKKAEDKVPPGIDKDGIKKAEGEEKKMKKSTW